MSKKLKLAIALVIFLSAWYILGFILPPLVVIQPLNKVDSLDIENRMDEDYKDYIGSDTEYDYYYLSNSVNIYAVNINGIKCDIRDAFQSGRVSSKNLTTLGFVECCEVGTFDTVR